MSDIAPSHLVGVFGVLAEIEEIGARVGDRIVVRPWALRPGLLQRTIEPPWAFTESCRLNFIKGSSLSGPNALRALRDAMGHPTHLTLLP